jgi:excisionase family DNA binding protein
MPATKLLSTGQAAQLLNVTPDTVVKWIRKGALPAQRTAGGHYRIAPHDLEQYTRTETRADSGEALVHCWEYYGVDGEVGEQCRTCLVYRARALRCFEMSSLSRDAGYVGTHCTTSCEECSYYQKTVGQPRRVLVVSDSVRLRQRLESDPRAGRFELRFSGCEYECSAMVEGFRPEIVVLDSALSEDRCNELCRHLAADPRIPGVMIVLATAEDQGESHGGSGESAAALSRPFTLAQLEEFIRGQEVSRTA